MAAEGPAPVGAPVVMNGGERPDLTLETDDQGGWSFRYEGGLPRPDPAEWLKKDAPQTDMCWKGWEAFADKWRNGLFGRHSRFQLEVPGRVRSVTAAAVVGNYADTAAGTALLVHSFDNVLWRPIAKGNTAWERKEFSGTSATKMAQVDSALGPASPRRARRERGRGRQRGLSEVLVFGQRSSGETRSGKTSP